MLDHLFIFFWGSPAAQALQRLLEDLPRRAAAGAEGQDVEAVHREGPRVGRRLLILANGSSQPLHFGSQIYEMPHVYRYIYYYYYYYYYY